MESLGAWFISTITVLALIYFGRGTFLQRKLRLADLHWIAAITFAAVIGLIPAFFTSQMGRSTAELPEGLADDKAVAASLSHPKK
ncbi:MAG: hypothetical protein QGF15_01240 [Alteromonas macleodii]|jgi:hypothetical protein|nr:hypothetical protein [Alteromonas macleodii]